MPIDKIYNPREVCIGGNKIKIASNENKTALYFRSMDIAKAIKRKGFRAIINNESYDGKKVKFSGDKSIYLTKSGVKTLLNTSRKEKIANEFKEQWLAWLENEKKRESRTEKINTTTNAIVPTFHEQNWWKGKWKWSELEAACIPTPFPEWRNNQFITLQYSKQKREDEDGNNREFRTVFTAIPHQIEFSIDKSDTKSNLNAITNVNITHRILEPPFIITPEEKIIFLPSSGHEELIPLKDDCIFPWKILHLTGGIAIHSVAYENTIEKNSQLPPERQKPIPPLNPLASKFIKDRSLCCKIDPVRGPLYVLPIDCVERVKYFHRNPDSWGKLFIRCCRMK